MATSKGLCIAIPPGSSRHCDWCREHHESPFNSLVVFVGSNTGVGEEIAKALAEKGMHVIMGTSWISYLCCCSIFTLLFSISDLQLVVIWRKQKRLLHRSNSPLITTRFLPSFASLATAHSQGAGWGVESRSSVVGVHSSVCTTIQSWWTCIACAREQRRRDVWCIHKDEGRLRDADGSESFGAFLADKLAARQIRRNWR